MRPSGLLFALGVGWSLAWLHGVVLPMPPVISTAVVLLAFFFFLFLIPAVTMLNLSCSKCCANDVML